MASSRNSEGKGHEAISCHPAAFGSFFGNLKNSGMYEGIWGNVTDDNRVWIGSRNGITFGRWDGNNPMVLATKPLEEGRYYVVAGRMTEAVHKIMASEITHGPSCVLILKTALLLS